MSLPFVSRQHHEDVVAFYKKSSDTAWEHYAGVLEKYHALKMQGATKAEPTPEARPKPEPDPVTQAILAKAGKSQQLRKHYYEFVNEKRKEGFSDDTIAAAILKGQDDMEGVP